MMEDVVGLYEACSVEDSDGNGDTVVQVAVQYVNKSEAYRLRQHKYTQQYMEMYFHRYHQLQHAIKSNALRLWKGCNLLERIKNVVTGVECVIIGTIYKDMTLKPCVLSQYMDEANQQSATPLTSYLSDSDSLFMEDETARVALSSLCPKSFVTGLVVAVKGVQNEASGFVVTDYCYPAVPSVPLTPRPDHRYVAIVSGLQIGDPSSDPNRLSLLTDFLHHLHLKELRSLSDNIVRLVIAGRTLTAARDDAKYQIATRQ
eukprot:GHVS01083751.1.p1 GENE.GHVS01083751.1~~GHVS01083751.1.p1  ORF type:complete len:259 (-),score=27.06 GHVS01083751.1:745-1521(-)